MGRRPTAPDVFATLLLFLLAAFCLQAPRALTPRFVNTQHSHSLSLQTFAALTCILAFTRCVDRHLDCTHLALPFQTMALHQRQLTGLVRQKRNAGSAVLPFSRSAASLRARRASIVVTRAQKESEPDAIEWLVGKIFGEKALSDPNPGGESRPVVFWPGGPGGEERRRRRRRLACF